MSTPRRGNKPISFWAFVVVTGCLLSAAWPVAAQHPQVVNSVLLVRNNNLTLPVTGFDPAGSAYVSVFPGPNGPVLAKIGQDGTVLQTFPLLLAAAEVAFDGSGNVYVLSPSCAAGSCEAPTATFGTTGNTGILVGKLNSGGTGFVWLDLVENASIPNDAPPLTGGMAVDAAGDVYLAGGATCSFATTAGSFEPQCAATGTLPSFAAKIDASGAKLDYATFLTGTTQSADQVSSMAIDGSGNLYVTGQGDSDWPTTPGAFETACNSNLNLACSFIAKLNPSGSALSYSTFLNEGATNSVAVDSQGSAYVTGTTSDAAFPTTAGSAEPTFSGWTPTGGNPMPAFAIKLKPDGSGLVYSTYVSLVDSADAQRQFCGSGPIPAPPQIALDTAGDAYVYGLTGRPNVTTVNAIQATDNHPQSGEGAFAVLNPQGSAYLYSSYLGGTGGDDCDNPIQLLAATSDGLVHMAGLTVLNDFPALTSTGPVPSLAGLPEEVPFVTAVQPNGKAAAPIMFDATPFAYLPSATLEENFGFACAGPSCVSTASTTAQGTVELGNYGATDQPVGSVATTGDFSQTNNCPATLAPGAECAIAVTFQPSSIGALTGTLTLTGGTASQEFQLDGTGLAAEVRPSASSVFFGVQSVGTSSPPQTVTVNNPGNDTLKFTSISTQGDFSQSNNCGGGVGAGGSCEVQVTFTPTAAGQRTGTLTLASNAINSSVSISLEGGVNADFSIAPPQGGTTSQTVTAGQTAGYSLSLASVAGFSGSVSLSCSGAPSDANCTVSPTSANLSGNSAVTIMVSVATTARSMVGGPSVSGPRGDLPIDGYGWYWFLAISAVLAWMWVVSRGRRAMAVRLLWATALLMAVVGVGCGGGSFRSGGGGGTAAGTYTIVVNASSGSTTHTENLTLIVQ